MKNKLQYRQQIVDLPVQLLAHFYAIPRAVDAFLYPPGDDVSTDEDEWKKNDPVTMCEC